jgi:hypothetical protein
MLAQVGRSESSKSAMNTFAPEFSALMIILRVDRPGDLDPAVLQRRRDRCDAPVAGADGAGVGTEIRQLAGIETRPGVRAARPAGLAFASKRTCRPASKVQRGWVSTVS